MALGLIGCEDQQQTQAEIAEVPVKVEHHYSLKDGYEYGYEQAISQDAADSGQAASTLLMFKYAGTKDGVYQAYTKEASGAISVLQCNNPCDFLKIMVFYDGEHLKTERMKATEGTIGWSVISDAINGQLEQYVGENKSTGQKLNVWFTEKDGLITKPLN